MAQSTKLQSHKRGQHNLSVDILACVGFLFLLGLSYLSQTGYPNEWSLDSISGILPIAVRWLCLSGGMLLSVLLGFSLSPKKATPSYYQILLRPIYIYLIFSLCALALRRMILQEDLDSVTVFEGLCSFSLSTNSKIFGIYFLLIIIAPFLNATFQGLKTKKARQLFLVVTALFTTLQPMLQWGDFALLPEWTKNLFPLAGYIGGLYIRRYHKSKDRLSMLIFAVLLFASEVFVTYAVSTSIYHKLYCPWLDSMATLPCLCIAMGIACMFVSKEEGDSSVHSFFKGACGGGLGALLLGESFLQGLKAALEERFPDLSTRLLFGLAIVPIVFILCTALSMILQAPFLGLRGMLKSTLDPEEIEDTSEAEDAEPSVNPQTSLLHEPTQSEWKNPCESSQDTAYQPKYAVNLSDNARETKPTSRKAVSPIQPSTITRSYSVDDILSEQGIAVKHVTSDVDDLISQLTLDR